MARTTTGLIESVTADDGIRKTPPSDVDYGVIIYTPPKVIIVGQVNLATQQTWTPEANTMEIVEPDELNAYIDSMLANGWTLAPGVRPDEE
jgi:hypothetical protein